eukprot:SM000082S22832  [mRNA]  locus=s82:252099:254468:+ [translate_table: standard]
MDAGEAPLLGGSGRERGSRAAGRRVTFAATPTIKLLKDVDSAQQRLQRRTSSRIKTGPQASDVAASGGQKQSPASTIDNSSTPSILLQACIAVALYFTLGLVTYFSHFDDIEGKKTVTVVDAIYFCVVTMTTVGYGDLHPANDRAKLITCAFVFVGFAVVDLVLSAAGNYILEKQEKLLLQAFQEDRGNEDSAPEGSACRRKIWLCLTLVLLGMSAGVCVLCFVEGMSLTDALYCVCVSVTTVGYGDLSFKTMEGRLFATAWLLGSTIFVAQFFFYLAEYRLESRQHKLTAWALSRALTDADLEAADLDDNGSVSLAEFVLFKLEEIGKVEKEDIVSICKEFDRLDVNHSGSLDITDLRGV